MSLLIDKHFIAFMNIKKWHIIVAVIVIITVIAIMALFFVSAKDSTTFEKDTTIEGNYAIPLGKEITIKNGSTLTSTGNMTIDGSLSCMGGTLSLVVTGDLRVRGTLRCALTGEDISSNSPSGIGLRIIATHIIFEKSAAIETNGHVIIMDNGSKLPYSKETLNAAYDETTENFEGGTQVGPFIEKDLEKSIPVEKIDSSDSSFMKTASREETKETGVPSLELRGTWNVGKFDSSLKNIDKLLFLIDMGEYSSITIEDLTINGGNGENGGNDLKNSCDARGENGANAFRVRIKAGHIRANNGILNLGNGGKGGDAETLLDCEEGRATGGTGGESGNIKISATTDIIIARLHINSGIGGNGGNALAVGRSGDNSCPSKNGGDAEAHGGNGDENKKNLVMHGQVTGIQYVEVSRVIGGTGGNAIAKPGNGGNSTSCDCSAGNGGNGKAIGGNGGNAMVSIPLRTGEGRGGDGGNAETRGGNGGNGFNCPSNLPGTSGGKGGNAVGQPGLPGKGATAEGNYGIVKNESGGNGGDGGDGCPPGLSGVGGIGAPLGTHGKAVNSTCTSDTQKPTNTAPVAPIMIKAILYKSRYLPLDQIIITNEPGCGEEHWRAEYGSVRATDNTIVPDADVVCGYGKISENKPILTTPQVARADANAVASTTDIFKVKF